MDVKNQRERLQISQLRLSKAADVSRFRLHLHEIHGLPLTTQELQRIQDVFRREANKLRNVIVEFEQVPA